MSDLSNRLGNLSRKERAALLELLRQRKEGAAAPVRPPEPEPPAPSPVELAPAELVPAGPPAGLPLSFAQQRLWFLDQLAPGSPLYNVTGGVRIEGPLDVPVLAACFGEVVRRHAALRTRFEMAHASNAGPVQVIETRSVAPFPLPVNDLSALSATLRPAEERRLVQEEIRTPFDLRRPPLLRLRLLRLGPDDHVLVLVLHHITGDAWSLDVLIREMSALYPALQAGRPSPLPELPLQYADFAVAQRGQLQGATLARELGFWRERLAGAPALELPTDRPRRAVPTFRGGAFTISIPAPLEGLLRRFAREERATLFMALAAPFAALLSRHADTGDVVVGTTVTGRSREYLGLIGFFVNTLALRARLSGDPDGRGLLAAARQTALDAFAHQALPFEKLVDELGLPRDPYRPPLLRVIFQLFPPAPPGGDGFSSLRVSKVDVPGETSKADLVVNFSEGPEGLFSQWRYDADLFDLSTIVRWSSSFLTLLAGWLEDPALRLAELPLFGASQRHQLLTEWNERPSLVDGGRRALPGLFEEQVDRTPDAPAVSMGSARMTYRELDERAEGLARWLLAAGVLPGDRVALLLDRSPEMVAAFLGVLKTGAAYVPLDPALPAERLGFLLADSGARLVLTSEERAGSLPDALPESIRSGIRPVLLDREPGVLERRSGARLRRPLDPELPAYVIYTSGSTGQPKGVAVPHGNVSHLVAATSPLFGFGPEDVWTLFHSYAFDFSVWEIWGALLHGARLVVVPYWESRSPEAFYRLLRTERVTVLNQTPSAFRQLLWAEEAVLSEVGADLPELALREVIFGGEALEPAMLAPWFARHGDSRPRLVNMYGITETTVHVTFRPLTREDVDRPGSRLGRPFPGPTVHVLDRALRTRPIGVPGELCVGGEGPAPGYLGRPELTAERFVPDPFGDVSGRIGSRLYRSGDLARWLPDGDLEYLGRIDHQVKIRGFRIEPGEVEAALVTHPGIREAVVLSWQEGAGADRRLVAWVTAGPAGVPPFPELREYLAGRLPEHMIPSALVVLDRLPLTTNGKVDRRALPAPDAAPPSASDREHVPPRDALERSLAGLWSEVLALPGQREIGIHDDFFALGGNSISGAVLINRLQATLGEIVHVVTIFDHPRLEALAEYVREQHPAAAARIWGVQAGESEAEAEAEASRSSVGDAQIAEIRRLIIETRPEADLDPEPGETPSNPPAAFVLSPPRSGSTLLRVMLGAHPRLFAPPELELLSFRTLAGRRAAFQGRDAFWLEGVTRAVMEARSCGPEEAARLVEEGEGDGWTTRRFYRELQEWISGRMLVDKTPSYALDPEVLRRAEGWFSGARYLHLLRHPQAARRSFEEARLDQIFFRRPHSFSRGQLAELIWTVSHRNVLDFLGEIPEERKWTVRFEELVRDPEQVLAGICGFLGLEYDPAMADPYRAGAGRTSSRMVDGPHAESRMLGDVKLLAHGKVDAAVGERWREAGGPPLGEPTRELAAALGYPIVATAGTAPRNAWEEGGTAPASFAQERLWLLDQLLPGSPAYNIPGALRLRGELDVPALGRVVTEIVRRHASLRTVFAAEAGQPVQRIEPASPRPIHGVDLGDLPEEARDPEVRRLAAAEVERPFDLRTGPLFRVTLLRVGPREHVVLYTMHHIVSDGWSMGVFQREVVALYAAFVAGKPSPLPEPPLQIPDVALRQRKASGEERMARALDWWKHRLAGLGPLDLPTDWPRPPVRAGHGSSLSASWRPELTPRLTALAQESGATLYMLLLAAFQTLLHRVTGQDDVAVGSPVANRTDRDTEGLIGFFVNTLVMRADLAGDPTFREMLGRVRRTTLEAFRHQEVPFERVVEAVQPDRQLALTPLFQVLFSLQNTPRSGAVALPGLTLEGVSAPAVTAKFDLSLAFTEAPDRLAARLEFDLDLFEPASAARLLRHLETLVEGALERPDARLSTLPLLTLAEREQILIDWNRTAIPFPRDLVLHRAVERQADLRPDAIAVSSDQGELSWAALDTAANRLAHRLRRFGAGPEVPVLVLVERSPELIVALLAVLKSGSCFVPLDPAHPRERLALLAGKVGARLAVTQEALRELLPGGLEMVSLDRDGEALAAERSSRPDGGALPANLMYVIFTSGSTGEPKGVAVTHQNAARLLFGNDFAEIGPGETYLVIAAMTFDPSILEVWGALVHGGRIAVLPPGVPTLDDLAGFLERHGVTQMHLATALFHQMAEQRAERLARLRRLAVGGESLSTALTRRVLEAAPGLLVTNCYGPAEATVITSIQDMSPEEARRPTAAIGRPIANTAVYVLDRGLEPAPVGVWGELYVGGEGLARGYFGRPDLTAERFVPDLFGGLAGQTGSRLYRTGDRARWRPDGVLDFQGRVDRQVKIRGQRIELGEIEAALTAHPAVGDAAVLIRGEGEQKRLVAYVGAGEQPDEGTSESLADELRSWLAARLPEPMVPADLVVLSRLPLTPNGKVDRRELARIAPERRSAGFVAPRTPVEERLASLWLEVLGAERTGGKVSVHDHFFHLGGHSLLATRLLAFIRDRFGVGLPLRAVFERPTLEEIARAIEEAPQVQDAARLPRLQGQTEGPAPLSFSQERLWLLDQIAPGTAVYNMPGGFRLRGGLDVAALRRAIAEIVRRHEALRTTFPVEGGQRPVQRVMPFDLESSLAVLPRVDLSALPEEPRDAESRRLAQEEGDRPFDLAAGPLFRSLLLRLAPREHILLYTMHHIVSDGWSLGVFFREVGLLYEAFAAGRPSPLRELPLQYPDFARRQRERLSGEALASGLAEWRRILEGVPPLELPTDRPRPVARSWRGDAVPFILGPAPSAGLAALVRSERSTLYILMLALFQTFLGRFSGQDDVAVGTAVANRTDPDVDSLIGFFVNTLVMRTDLSGDPPFREVIGRAREVALEAFHFQEIPFEKVVEAVQPERHTSRSPLFQVMMTVQNIPLRELPAGGLTLESVDTARGTAKFDLTLAPVETPAGLAGALELDLDLFDPGTARRMVRHLVTLIEGALVEPDRRISELPLLTALEREQIVLSWNQTAVPIPRGLPLHRLIEEQADRAPDAVAISATDADLTYAALDAAANRLARRLRHLGAGPEVPVLVLAERSPELIVALLAVMKSGSFFVPLDPTYPRERLAALAARTGAHLAVTWERSLDLLPAGISAVCMDRDRDGIAAESPQRLEDAKTATDGNLLYVMFTSGSTGEPKGVAVTHRNVVRLVRGTDFAAMGPGETFLMVAPASFDASTLELWGPLANGGRIAVFPPHVPSLDELAGFFGRLGVTELFLTSGLFHQMAEERPGAFAGLRRLMTGGDVLAPTLLRKVLTAHPGLVLVAAYGPTEGTTFTTCHPLTAPDQLPAGGSVPLGLPIANTTVHILERTLEGSLEGILEPAPLGVWGELCIGGAGLARGYFGRPDLTAERFVPDPFSLLTGALGERLYRTGDLARRRPDGVLEFLGRIDRQVKIRGFRIEPAEVEAALAKHPEVADVAVLVRGEGVDKRLVAYVATGIAETAAPGVQDELGAELRRWLGGRLPEPMIPAAVVVLPRLPLTANGKVDRRELAKIAPERKAAELVAPRTPVEETLAALFVEVLGPERTGGRVGVHDSFFELGGHSLLATRLVAAIRDAFRIELPLRLVFERPTLEGLAAAISEAGAAVADATTATGPDPSVRVTRLERTPGGVHRFPVSFSQLREWILDRLEPGNPAYNIPSNLRIAGPLSVPILEAALRELLRRHEALRTAFEAAEEEPVQVVAPEVPFHVPVVDLSALPGSLREIELSRRVRTEGRTGFDLSVAPLLRALVVRLGIKDDAEDHALLATMHHIVSDGWSMGIFNRELVALYQAIATGQPSPLPELPVQYGDYAAWQRARLGGAGLDEQLAWWRQRLASAPPLLELPTDRPRPPVRSSRGGRVPILLPERLSTDLRALRRGTTPFMVILAGFQALLARWSGQEDVLVGTYSGNRPRRELEGLIGFFINTLVLRTDLGREPSFGALLDRVRETTLGAYTHADVPFEKLLETLHLPRDPSRTPLFQILLVLQNFPPARADLTTGVRLTGMANQGDKSDYDLALWLGEGPDGIGGTFEYSTDLFEEATIVRLADQLRTLLEAAVAEPDRNVWTLPLIGEEERTRLLQVESRGPDVPSGEPLLHRLVEAQAVRTPDAVAVEAGSVRLTYAELIGRASRLAHRLREAGAGPESIVGLSAERSPDLIVGMLAILQAGAAYLPLDPAYPPDRLDLMLEDSGATILVAPPSSPLARDIQGVLRISFEDSTASLEHVPPLPGDGRGWERGPGGEGLPAYVIYTSGSTGRPKGVVVPHRAISSFTRAARDTYGVGPGDRVLQFASISFDTSAEEIWPALTTGATLVLRPDDMATSIPHFLRESERLGITLLDLPTAFWHELAVGMDTDPEAGSLGLPRGLRLVIIGGEEALADRLAAWRRRVPPSVRLVNTYGPTESTIVATRRELAGFGAGTVPIGRPIPGARAYLLDRFFEPVPPGVRGELWIGGAGVARGYLKRPDLTAERFIPDPFGGEPGARLYRTGDLGVLRPDGDLVFAGRADRQLKVRGYRIEPGEIEAALRLHPDLHDAAVDARGPSDVRRLVAWVVPREGVPVEAAPDSSDLRAFLRGRLPDPMLPAAFMAVAALPLTPSGKVDRRALPEPTEARSDAAGWAEPQTGLERTIAGIFRELLRVDRVGLNDNFFDLGGHSLLVVRAHQKLKEALGKEIAVLDLFRFPTVASLARHLGGEETGTLKKVQNLAEQQRAAQLRQKQVMERMRRPGGPVRR
jgi:amino acid adenylation domain-containing protein